VDDEHTMRPLIWSFCQRASVAPAADANP